MARGVPVRQDSFEDEYPPLTREERPIPPEEEEPEPPVYEDLPDLPAPEEPEPAVNPAEAEAAPPPVQSAATVDWKALCERVSPRLPLDLRFSLEDPGVVRPAWSGDLLQLLVQPGFKFDRFKRQEVMESFAEEASALAGRTILVQVGELREQSRPQRSLEELRPFKEVHFK